MFEALREHDPVHPVPAGDFWGLSRFADVQAAALDAAIISSANGLTFFYGDLEQAGMADVKTMVTLDPPDHTEFRRLVMHPRRSSVACRHDRRCLAVPDR